MLWQMICSNHLAPCRSRYVYERTPAAYNTLATFVVSAFWHGIYPGYYAMFVYYCEFIAFPPVHQIHKKIHFPALIVPLLSQRSSSSSAASAASCCVRSRSRLVSVSCYFLPVFYFYVLLFSQARPPSSPTTLPAPCAACSCSTTRSFRSSFWTGAALLGCGGFSFRYLILSPPFSLLLTHIPPARPTLLSIGRRIWRRSDSLCCSRCCVPPRSCARRRRHLVLPPPPPPPPRLSRRSSKLLQFTWPSRGDGEAGTRGLLLRMLCGATLFGKKRSIIISFLPRLIFFPPRQQHNLHHLLR